MARTFNAEAESVNKVLNYKKKYSEKCKLFLAKQKRIIKLRKPIFKWKMDPF